MQSFVILLGSSAVYVRGPGFGAETGATAETPATLGAGVFLTWPASLSDLLSDVEPYTSELTGAFLQKRGLDAADLVMAFLREPEPGAMCCGIV